MPVNISIPRSVQTRFKQRACRAYPLELIGFLIGRRREENSLDLIDIWIPPDWKDHSTELRIEMQDRWYVEAAEFAAAKKLVVLGTVHTHVYGPRDIEHEAVLSKTDQDGWCPLDLTAGVMNVVQAKNGRKKCGPIEFYGRPSPVTATIK